MAYGIDPRELDRHITGNYGEDSVTDEAAVEAAKLDSVRLSLSMVSRRLDWLESELVQLGDYPDAGDARHEITAMRRGARNLRRLVDEWRPAEI